MQNRQEAGQQVASFNEAYFCSAARTEWFRSVLVQHQTHLFVSE